MAKQGTLLVIDDNRSILTSLKYLMDDYFIKVLTTSVPGNVPTLLKQEDVNVVLLDMNFSPGINNGNEGLFWLREIKKLKPDVAVVLFTAYADIALAVTGMKEGAYDFVEKPWDNAKLVKTLLDAYKSTCKKNILPNADTDDSMYWGDSSAMKQLRQMVEKTSATDASVLITGENGTGKDMLAREIHRLSKRSCRQMVTVDMGAIPESLFESELFGHVRGSFTSAHADRTGRFEAADGGTLFLDEIANLPYYLQSKLLTAIQKKCFVKVGSNIPQATDIRLICATNRNIEEMVAKGEFREDLFYRINTIHLNLPPLRERREDILPLARYFVKKYSRRYGRDIHGISQAACEKLVSYNWPGNIRELQHVMEKCVILSDGYELKIGNLQANNMYLSSNGRNKENNPLQTLDEMERDMIKKAIDVSRGNLSQAATRLGITRQTLYNKMKRYGL